MERLTFEGNFCEISRCEGEYRMTSECAEGACSQRKVWERLKEYEDAEEQGRLVVLPCKELFEKIGDDIYIIVDGEIIEVLLCLVGFDQTRADCIEVLYGKSQEDEQGYSLRFADVGKTVFLTRKEAEAALKGDESDEA